MQLLAVIDLRRGQAVHARGGVREKYRPIRRVAGRTIPEGDPVMLARAYVDLGIRQIYVADLDAIVDGRPQRAVLEDLLTCQVPLWVDAGVSSPAQARELSALGISQVIVGLETLPSFAALAGICSTIDAGVAFSLDLRHGQPLGTGGTAAGTPEDLATAAAAAGARTVIVLDLARVGSGAGLDLPLLARIRAAVPTVTLAAGGGVRDDADLGRLAGVGCDAALVGTALLAGTITPRIVERES
jgi:phosphoribosylformimino-5-aminoimidazole carboxamide ribotide isomerase